MTGDELDTSATFTQLGLSLSSNLTWKICIHSLAKHTSQKLGFLARPRGFFSLSYLYTTYKSEIRPSFRVLLPRLGWCSKFTLCLLDKFQLLKPSLSQALHAKLKFSSMVPRHFKLSYALPSALRQSTN